ncbi:MAG: non-homologous end-joining DNA ligase [Thermoleophilaceae bacterium]
MSPPLEGLSQEERALVRRAGPPQRADAMKAVLTGERFSDPDWIYERKLDGIRCIAIRSGKQLRMLSRNDLSLNARYPELADALTAEPCERFAVDGEVVAFAGAQTSFARLAQRHQRDVSVFLYAFDLIWLDGNDVRGLPLRARKRLLRGALDFKGPVRLTQHRNEHGEAYFEEACRKRWEGLIAKRADSPYTAKRSRDWLKFKCERGQELVIGGYTQPYGSRIELGALLMGYYADSELRYAGKVGTGFDQSTLRELGAKLRRIERQTSPFAEDESIRERGVTWVEPRLVAEIGFSEWTRHGRLRHPRFLGLRFDKSPREVVREE